MNDLPLPLTPADCDLTDFQFMPLEVRRLRDSDLASLEAPEACWAAVLLWCSSWHQVPAASLPDDDRVLSNLAGYGRVVKEWQRVREGALRGWVKCSDGRLYHPVVAEKANESWLSKVKYAYDKLADRTRKANGKREKEGLPSIQIPTLEEWVSSGRPSQFPLPSKPNPLETGNRSSGKSENSSGNDPHESGNPSENALKGQGQGQGELKDKKQPAAANTSDSEDPAQAGSPPPHVEGQKAETRYNLLIRQWEKARGKAPKVTSSDPRLAVWAQKGVTEEQLQEAYELAVADRDQKADPAPINAGFLDTFLAKVLNPKGGDSALNRPGATGTAKPWQLSWTSIEAKAEELGVKPVAGEHPQMFKARVFTAAGVTDEDRARLRADFGVTV